MEIGIVIHGPNVVDSGMAKETIDKIKELGHVSAVMAGTIGKTAVLDAHLEDIIDIRKNLKPSKCIEEYLRTKDLVILLNHGKTIDNGLFFANIVMSRVENLNVKPLIHIERPGMADGKIVPWNSDSIEFALKAGELLQLKSTEIPELVNPISIEDQGHCIIRRIYGVHRGEKIMVNGIIVGVAESEDIRIVSEDGFIKEIDGAKIKEHGLEKLHGYNDRIPVDLRNCWIKSGPIRGNKFSVRNKDKIVKYICNDEKNDNDSEGRIKAVIIDHEAERTFELVKGANVAVTIGDDTTDVAADILYRLGIPVIGITDGDIDGVGHFTHICTGSVIIRFRAATDDKVGKRILDRLFKGNKTGYFRSIESLCNKIFELSTEEFTSKTEY